LNFSVRAHRLTVVLLIAATVGVLVALILYRNNGTFTYVLDDPYIHLVMARSIAAGHYGFNPTEFSSPSSSIAWPFLLAPFVWVGIGTIAPAIINTIALLLTTYLLHQWLTDEMGADGLAASTLTVTIVLACNLISLVFVGMEHSLQILLGFLACRGITRIESQRAAGWAFWMAVVAGPLVRYEMLAISGVAIVFAAWRTKRLVAPGAAALFIVLTVGGFGAFLASNTPWWLPGSVIEKSDYFGTTFTLQRFTINFLGNAGAQPGTLLAFLAVLSVAGAMRRREKTVYAVMAVLWMLAELMAGQLGWYRRYEIWAVTSISFMAIATWAPISEWSRQLRPVPLIAGAVCAFVATSPHWLLIERIPTAANNIYNQQYQMGLLVQRLGVRSIAVNDIGAVGWMNPDVYLLDLVGLASVDVLEHKSCCPKDASWLEKTAAGHGVELILIYDGWIPARPEIWTRIGELQLIGKRITPADATVSIYAPNPQTAETLGPRLAALALNLPPLAQLTPVSSAHPGSQ
jgi:hypothetical protein